MNRSLRIIFYTFLFFILFSLDIQAKENSWSETFRSKVNQFLYKGDSSELVKKDQCPPILEEWAIDDLKDKSSWGLDYKSEIKTCQSQIQNYRDIINQKNKSLKFPNPANLSDYYSNKFSKQINPAYKKSIDNCNQLSTEKAFVTQTRFYSAGTKLEAANSSIIDELAHIDAILPDTVMLNGIECPFIWPEIKSKCDLSKWSAKECDSTKKQQLSLIVKKTQDLVPMIEDLIAAQHNCVKKISREPSAKLGRSLTKKAQQKIKNSCDPIGSVIEILKNEIPWVRGADFQEVTVKQKASPRNAIFSTKYDLSDSAVALGITKQLKHNRNALVETYKKNLEDFRCLTSAPKGNMNCDFEEIRTHLQVLPDLRNKELFSKNSEDNEAKMYFEAESCLLERHEDRAQTKNIVDDKLMAVTFTLISYGLIVASGIKVVNATSKLTQYRQGSLYLANTGLNVTLAGQASKQFIQACSSETKAVIDVANQVDLNKENVCYDPKSSLSQAKDLENHCILTAILTAPSVLPFISAVPSLKSFAMKVKMNEANVGNINPIANTTGTIVETKEKLDSKESSDPKPE
ncbi:MAG: hypothetical protein H6625_13830 [Bdellovibrionaceae bacterium]|nr:hypothetical protein [Pseudobdellovibrionaceae bacterium]